MTIVLLVGLSLVLLSALTIPASMLSSQVSAAED
jgi:hypothetical protein